MFLNKESLKNPLKMYSLKTTLLKTDLNEKMYVLSRTLEIIVAVVLPVWKNLSDKR